MEAIFLSEHDDVFKRMLTNRLGFHVDSLVKFVYFHRYTLTCVKLLYALKIIQSVTLKRNKLYCKINNIIGYVVDHVTNCIPWKKGYPDIKVTIHIAREMTHTGKAVHVRIKSHMI